MSILVRQVRQPGALLAVVLVLLGVCHGCSVRDGASATPRKLYVTKEIILSYFPDADISSQGVEMTTLSSEAAGCNGPAGGGLLSFSRTGQIALQDIVFYPEDNSGDALLGVMEFLPPDGLESTGARAAVLSGLTECGVSHTVSDSNLSVSYEVASGKRITFFFGDDGAECTNVLAVMHRGALSDVVRNLVEKWRAECENGE